MRLLLALSLVVGFVLPGIAAGQERRVPPPERAPQPKTPPPETPRLSEPRQGDLRKAAIRLGGNPSRVLNGTYVATRIDNEALPLTDRVVEEDGTLYLIEFDRMVLALRDDNGFKASIRYRRTLFSSDPRGRSRTAPLQSMTVTGRYTIVDGKIDFVPDPSQEVRGLKMLVGNVRSSRELVIPFYYRNGTQERDRTLVMSRRDNIL